MSALFNLYSSEGCHLCEQAHQIIIHVIDESQLAVIDIIEDKIDSVDLVELYGVHIPVLERLADNTRLFWPFDQAQVEELL